MHPFTGIQLTTIGIDALVEYVGRIREAVGYTLPLAADHFGHLGLESCIRLGRALDQFTLAWYEDMIPWQFTDQYVRLSESVTTPICTGEDIYLRDGFRDLVERRAVGVVHPDIMTSGGILETKRIGDYAGEHGIAMALHMAGSPVAALASVHAAAATEHFLALENHSADIPEWSSLVSGLPDAAGRRTARSRCRRRRASGSPISTRTPASRSSTRVIPSWFAPTPGWDTERAHDRLWS